MKLWWASAVGTWKVCRGAAEAGPRWRRATGSTAAVVASTEGLAEHLREIGEGRVGLWFRVVLFFGRGGTWRSLFIIKVSLIADVVGQKSSSVDLMEWIMSVSRGRRSTRCLERPVERRVGRTTAVSTRNWPTSWPGGRATT